MNTLSEIEEYYKAREQQLLEKLHQQEAASAAMPDGYPSCPERRITAAQLSCGCNQNRSIKSPNETQNLTPCIPERMHAAGGSSLTSCGEKEAKDSGLAQIVVGSDSYPPYIYLNNDGVPTGIDVEIATEAFRRMGYAARFETINWEQKTNLVESGAIDCIWGCFSMDGREEVYRWAGPYMVSRQVVAVDADSSIRSLSDLAGKTIAVQSTGKPEEIFLSGSDPRIPQTVEVLSIENRSVQYAMLACGYVDGIAAHETGILQYMKDNAVDFRILEEPLLVTGLGIAFAKNDTRGLDSQLTDTLAQMRADGTLERIIDRYLENASQYLEVDTIGA